MGKTAKQKLVNLEVVDHCKRRKITSCLPVYNRIELYKGKKKEKRQTWRETRRGKMNAR